MIAILKTLPTSFARGHIDRFLACFGIYFFTLGRGRPSKADYAVKTNGLEGFLGVDQLYFTHRGEIIGHFAIEVIVQNVGQLPPLTNMDGDPSA